MPIEKQAERSFSSMAQSALQMIKSNKQPLFFGIGIIAFGLILKQYQSTRIKCHRDYKRIADLKQTIAQSYVNALQSLQTLRIQRQIYLNYYGQSQKITENTNQNNIKMQFNVASNLKRKEKSKEQQLRNPFLPPFEDGLFITELHPHHRLMYNKFNVFKNHLLVITKEFEAQETELNEKDFKMVALTIKALDGTFFFNCGKLSGASQPHKHIQIFPQQALSLPLVQEMTKLVQWTKLKTRQNYQKGYTTTTMKTANSNDKLQVLVSPEVIQFEPFKDFLHGIVVLPERAQVDRNQSILSLMKKDMLTAYKLLLETLITPHKIDSYNLIGTQEFLLMVPRKKQAAFGQIGVNSAVFMGSVLFRDEQKLNKYLKLGISPCHILKDITFSKEDLKQRQ